MLAEQTADDLGLEDEEALLDDDVVLTTPSAGDCSTKRRACKDCSCGRAEQEATEEAEAAAAAMPSSSCGNVRALNSAQRVTAVVGTRVLLVY